MEPIDLKRIAKERYWKIAAEDHSEYPAHYKCVDPWMVIVPCQFGHLYAYGKEKVGIAAESATAVSRLLEAGFTSHQPGHDEANFWCLESQLDKVAEIMRPRKRRRVTEANREAARKRIAEWNSRRRDTHPADNWRKGDS